MAFNQLIYVVFILSLSSKSLSHITCIQSSASTSFVHRCRHHANASTRPSLASASSQISSSDWEGDAINNVNTNRIQPTSTTRKKSTSTFLPPPKDEIQIQVMEKEVQETVRLLEGLKFGSKNTSPYSKSSGRESSSALPVATSSTTRQLSRQQKQERELMQSLKQSLKQSQHQRSISAMRSNTPRSPSSIRAARNINPVVASSPVEQLVQTEKIQYYVEQLRMRAANDLKAELSSLGLPDKGRKPDLVNRLAEYYVSNEVELDTKKDVDDDDDDDDDDPYDDDHKTDFKIPITTQPLLSSTLDRPISFAGIPRISAAAASALHRAFGNQEEYPSSTPKPTPIQECAIPYLFHPPNPSALLHAPTGSGKTIAYLLPITETLWKEVESGNRGSTEEDEYVVDANDMTNGMAIILLPTRELAAQVAGVASVLAPPGMVKLIPRPMDLMRCWKDEIDRGEEYEYLQSIAKDGNSNDGNESAINPSGRRYKPRILLGSAKAIGTSLFGDSKMPGTPTRKPVGKQLLSSVRWLVMDECDRLLNIEKSRSEKKSRRHEKPAALLAAAIARLTLGRVQVIAASATIGRPLRRELSRVLGLHSSECPETIRGEEDTANWEQKMSNDDDAHVGRAVKIPDAVTNYVLPVDGSTTGSLLTAAAFASKAILRPEHGSTSSTRKVLLVLTRNCGIKVHNALGALRHFGIQPEPESLLDALEADGTDRLVEAHRRVSQVEGVGGGAAHRSDKSNARDREGGEGYLLIAHEDNVRGLHLAGLDAVVVVGRPGSPDEYTHIAGRTGRAGRRGSVLNIVSFEQAAALASWTKMLGVDFLPVDETLSDIILS